MSEQQKLTVYLSQEEKIKINEGGIGLFLEDLNYALDGGLYAEMLENRNFEAKDARGEKDRFTVEDDGGYAWEVYPAGADALLKVKTDRPLFNENPHYMRVQTQTAGAGMKNKAYDGIYLKKGVGYKISFYARSYDYKDRVTISLSKGETVFAQKKIKLKADGNWNRYAFRIKSKYDADGADFCFTLNKAGMVHADCFSMMPENAVLGVFRRDLVELLKGMKPGFLRFPGGCVVEGNGLENRYLWKNSIGQAERRKHNWNRWAVHDAKKENNYRTPFSHYGQTLGIGYYEYFRLCEYLGAKPLPVVSVGIACQYMSSECVPLNSQEMELYIQEALDVVEFARGGADTVWGKVRMQMGHPEPFRLEYLGIGNEQWEVPAEKGKEGNAFYKRFELFEKVIRERYPDLRIIGTVGPTVGTPTYDDAWKWIDAALARDPDFIYAADEHFYVPPQWLYEHAEMYGDYPRTRRVYAGEYAAHVAQQDGMPLRAPQANVWEGALAEAAFMTGMERHADVVVMKSYAPLFGRIGYTQWAPNLVWFNGKTAFPSCNYHVQKLYSDYTGDFSLRTKLDAAGCYASATVRDAFTYVKIVNAGDTETECEVTGDFDFGALTQIIRMEGEKDDYNSPERPDKIAPCFVAPLAPRALTLPARSFSVLVFKK